MVACGCFATFLATFVIVLTNHLPAAVSAGIALFAALKIIYDGDRRDKFVASECAVSGHPASGSATATARL